MLLNNVQSIDMQLACFGIQLACFGIQLACFGIQLQHAYVGHAANDQVLCAMVQLLDLSHDLFQICIFVPAPPDFH